MTKNTPPPAGRPWSTKKKVLAGTGGLAGFGCLGFVGLLVLGMILSVLGYEAPEKTTAQAGTTASEPTPAAASDRTPAPTPTPSPSPTPAPTAEAGTALAMLYELEVKGRAPKTGYDRDLFGWRNDVDRNGCDTRNDVLRRDLHDITLKTGGCVVLGGVLDSDYTGDVIDFIRGDGNNIDIDHVVALSNAWQTGAQQLSETERVAFGNDPLNLMAVESEVNSQKGDGDAATWLPPHRPYRCEYVARQIAVKHKYDLWVVEPEFDAMERLLTDCDQDAIDRDLWPAPGDGDIEQQPSPESQPDPEPEPEPRPERGGSGGSGGGSSGGDSGSGGGPGSRPDGAYKNCTEARARGGAPVYAGSPGYGEHLDRDGDGVGCE